uniref:Uncharacterized protein n=1 Tax=Aegilops tauschii subsp. strangulata TaxID=200361 RepID=A0A453Q560_AEGTS
MVDEYHHRMGAAAADFRRDLEDLVCDHLGGCYSPPPSSSSSLCSAAAGALARRALLPPPDVAGARAPPRRRRPALRPRAVPGHARPPPRARAPDRPPPHHVHGQPHGRRRHCHGGVARRDGEAEGQARQGVGADGQPAARRPRGLAQGGADRRGEGQARGASPAPRPAGAHRCHHSDVPGASARAAGAIRVPHCVTVPPAQPQ